MVGILGTISNVISSCSKLLPSIRHNTSSTSSETDDSKLVEEELRKLMRTLERIKTTIYDAEEQEIRDRSVKLWVEELRQIAYAAEDIMSEYQYEAVRYEVAARDGSKRDAQSKTFWFYGNNSVVKRIKEIRDLFDQIAIDRNALQLRKEDGRRCNDCRRYNNRISSHLVNEGDIFGREAKKEKRIDLIDPESRLKTNCKNVNGTEFKVLPIVGKGGLGKTTIAQMIYNDPRIRLFFDKFSWSCVSEDFSLERITQDMIECITGCSVGLKNLSALQENLKKNIKRKSVFVVLDDVWNEDKNTWQLVSAPFMNGGAKKVIILITTRNNTVAEIMQTMPPSNLEICLMTNAGFYFNIMHLEE